eukprot:SAG11_NODE_366_length_10128_cov_4.162030_8_plen_51_part_00
MRSLAYHAIFLPQELLKYHARVLYIDLDYFHGDGVEVSDSKICAALYYRP